MVKNEETFDIVQDRESVVDKYTGSTEVDKISSEIEVYNPDSIISFGSKVAEEISKASDVVLNNVGMNYLDDTNTMLKSISKIMDQFDLKEITEEPRGIKRIFNNVHKQLDKVIAKYNTFGSEIDKIYVQLKQYESEIKESNKNLSLMFDSALNQYHTLVQYILAGEQGCKEIEDYIAQKEEEFNTTQNNELQIEIQSLRQALTQLEQRVQDLRVAENIAMQSVPMIKSMEFSNINLLRKIDSAFIITLPIFKQAVAQAVMLKKQRLQADSLAVLDEKTNELLKKNAQNTAEQTKQIAQLTVTSSIKIETLEETWKTIIQGVEETKEIYNSAKDKRVADKVRLEELKSEFSRTYGAI